MFLLEYSEGMFINGEDIQWISIGSNSIGFTLRGDIDGDYAVTEPMQAAFLNHLQSLNSNINNIESAHKRECK